MVKTINIDTLKEYNINFEVNTTTFGKITPTWLASNPNYYKQQLPYQIYNMGNYSFAACRAHINPTQIVVNFGRFYKNELKSETMVTINLSTHIPNLRSANCLRLTCDFYEFDDTNPYPGLGSDTLILQILGVFRENTQGMYPYKSLMFVHRMWFDRNDFKDLTHPIYIHKIQFQPLYKTSTSPYDQDTFTTAFLNSINFDKDYIYTCGCDGGWMPIPPVEDNMRIYYFNLNTMNCGLINTNFGDPQKPSMFLVPIYAPRCTDYKCLWFRPQNGEIYEIYFNGSAFVKNGPFSRYSGFKFTYQDGLFDITTIISREGSTGINFNYLYTCNKIDNSSDVYYTRCYINDITKTRNGEPSLLVYPLYKRYENEYEPFYSGISYPHNVDPENPYYYAYNFNNPNLHLIRINGYNFCADNSDTMGALKYFLISNFIKTFVINGCLLALWHNGSNYLITFFISRFQDLILSTEDGINQRLFDKSFTTLSRPAVYRNGDFEFPTNAIYPLFTDRNEFIGDFIIEKIRYDSFNTKYQFIDANSEGKQQNTLTNHTTNTSIPFSQYASIVLLNSKRNGLKISNCNENIQIKSKITSSIFNLNDIMFSKFDCGMKTRNGYIEFDGNGIISPYCIGYNKEIGSDAPYGKWVEWGVEEIIQDSSNIRLYKIKGVCNEGVYERIFHNESGSGYSIKYYFPGLTYNQMKEEIDSINLIDNLQNSITLVVNQAIFDEYDIVYVDFSGIPTTVMPFMSGFVGTCIVVDSVYYPENDMSRITIQNLYYVKNLESQAYYNDQLIENLIDGTGHLIDASNIMFKYGKARQQSIAVSTAVSIYFTHKIYDLGNNMVYADGNYWYFKPPVNGIYHFEVVLTTIKQSFTAGRYLHLFLTDGTGTMIARLDYYPIEANTSVTQILLQGSTDIYLQANTRVYVRLFHNNGSSVSIESDAELSRNAFIMRLIRKL